ncbi:hypothetical protein KUCAC02_025293 [Chaenocephalus aceratus]|uniref:Uncharacterized protein n=1 Tax=Chaenocephalus aceratus TaxID=36190 RepID=A0ACB9VTQ3_CHAAC|nr:hypothetical protein KUCAC02_025293 [Chaenocephalus aceratus]
MVTLFRAPLDPQPGHTEVYQAKCVAMELGLFISSVVAMLNSHYAPGELRVPFLLLVTCSAFAQALVIW